MAVKPGNGGHGMENYDPETGQYVRGNSSIKRNFENSQDRIQMPNKWKNFEILKSEIFNTLGLSDKDVHGEELAEKYSLTKEDIVRNNEIDQLQRTNEDNTQVSETAKKLAQEKRAFCESNEPKIRKDVYEIVKSLGGLIFGDEKTHLKTVDSLARKVYFDVANSWYATEEEALENISDAIRYTYIFNNENFVESANKSIELFDRLGYKVKEFRNRFDNQKGYRDLNVILETPEGVKFELQMNTPEGACAKEAMEYDDNKREFRKRADGIRSSHYYYEQLRTMNEQQRNSVRGRYLQYMIEKLWADVPLPPNIEKLGENIKR